MSGHVITDTADLAALCTKFATARWIALDTEFMRVNTYRARLCLVQLATPDEVVCVDPLAIADLGPLFELLYAPGIVKVLHAARQDLEVLADVGGAPARPVFDTQIAAALAGYDDQIGYGNLVEKLTGHKLAKVESRTDWAARPLTPAQIRYAEDDVHYLRDVYLGLAGALEKRGRAGWLEEECRALTEPALYRNDAGHAWQRLGAGATLEPAQQTILVALATWRERAAQERDTPRGWVVPDSALIEIARRQVTTRAALAEVVDIKPAAIRRDGDSILQAVTDAQRLPAKRYWDAPERLDAGQMAEIKRLSALVQEKARTEGISATLVAPRRELVRLVRGERDVPLLRGWRRAWIGEQLVAEIGATSG